MSDSRPSVPKHVLETITYVPRRRKSSPILATIARFGRDTTPPPPSPTLPTVDSAESFCSPTAKTFELKRQRRRAQHAEQENLREVLEMLRGMREGAGLLCGTGESTETLRCTSGSAETLCGMRSVAMPPMDHWAPRDGLIIIKVRVPATDDLWAIRSREGVSLAEFRMQVAMKIGFRVMLERADVRGKAMVITDEVTFRMWVHGRVRNGKNQALVARPA